MAKPTPTKNKAKDAAVKSLADLQQDLAAKQQDLLDAKRSHRAGELVNPRVLGATRKDIARLHTAIRETKAKETN